jgi:hypothetical protein
MANYEAIRDQIVEKLREVDLIGKVFKQEQYVESWTDFANTYGVPNPYDKSKNLLKVVWLKRSSVKESDEPPFGGRMMNDTLTTVSREETWTITVLYSYDSEEDAASEIQFQTLVDNILEKFRWLEQLGLSAIVHISHPAVVTQEGLFMLGNQVLVHRANIDIKLFQRFDVVT